MRAPAGFGLHSCVCIMPSIWKQIAIAETTDKNLEFRGFGRNLFGTQWNDPNAGAEADDES